MQIGVGGHRHRAFLMMDEACTALCIARQLLTTFLPFTKQAFVSFNSHHMSSQPLTAVAGALDCRGPEAAQKSPQRSGMSEA